MEGATADRPRTRPERVRVGIAGLSCAADAVGLERRLRGVPGLQRVTVNPVTETAYATFDPDRLSLANLQAEIEWAGYGIRPAS